MSSSTPGSKRRRIDQVQSALHKPFRSPLKTAQNGNNNVSPSSTLNGVAKAGVSTSSVPKTPARSKVAAGQTPRNALYRPFTPSTLVKATLPGSFPAKPQEHDQDEEPEQTQDTPLKRQRLNASPDITEPPRSLSQQSSTSHSNSTTSSSQIPETEVILSTTPAIRASPFKAPLHPPIRSSHTPSRPILKTAMKTGTITPGSFLRSPSFQSENDPEIAELDRSIWELESQTRALRNQIDALRAAEGLPSQNSNSKGDSKLDLLLCKWRTVSQEAAETVFADVSTRFKDAGGMRGYKRTQRTRQREQEMEDMAWESANSFSASSAEEKEALEEIKQKREMEDKEMVDEEEEFTMETMLGMLHIEPGVIGWDGGRQGWV